MADKPEKYNSKDDNKVMTERDVQKSRNTQAQQDNQDSNGGDQNPQD